MSAMFRIALACPWNGKHSNVEHDLDLLHAALCALGAQ